MLGFRDKTAGREECRSGASFDSAGNESSSDKSNIVTKAGAMINNVDGGEAGEQNWRARKKAAEEFDFKSGFGIDGIGDGERRQRGARRLVLGHRHQHGSL